MNVCGRRLCLKRVRDAMHMTNFTATAAEANDEILERCSDAVLVLGDGSTVPCSRYVIMAECHVLRAMMDLRTTVRPDGRHEIPVMDVGFEKYSNFCAIVHAIKIPEALTFDELVDVFDAARRLGADSVERIVLRRAWSKAPNVYRALPLIPDLFRSAGKSCVTDIIAAISTEYPLWIDVERTVLSTMTAVANEPRIVDALLMLQLHYSPSAVASWVLTHARTMTETLLLKIVTTNSHLFCPDEIRPLYEWAIELCGVHPDWEPAILMLLGSFVKSTELSSQIPRVQGVCGIQVEFEDLPRTLVSATMYAHRTHGVRPVQLGPYIRIRTPRKNRAFGFDIRMAYDAFQVRVTMSRKPSFECPFYEAWHDMHGAEGQWIEAGIPRLARGEASDELADKHRTAYVRFDIRHGKSNAITHPFG